MVGKCKMNTDISDLEKLTWSKEKANEWYAQNPWLVGCNYIPSNAINQLEMFQADTFDINQIDKELGWAQSIGFNLLRIYLHYLLWEQDASGLKKRMKELLEICEKHQMKVLFVFFDDCWVQDPKIGKQSEPIPGVHNSGWAASPGSKRVVDKSVWPKLKQYVQEILTEFSQDNRILGWDLYNEPGNEGMLEKTLPLLIETYRWAREIKSSQPLTAGIWNQRKVSAKIFEDFNRIQSTLSDFISFHNYSNFRSLKRQISKLKKHGRPIICTEYMARPISLFETHLPVFKETNVGCINWGLVAGKTQTIYPWGSKEGGLEPEVWFHDIFHPDGTPYLQKEVDFIRDITK